MAAHRLKEYFFTPESAPGERKLVRKIDFFILTFCCLMYVSPSKWPGLMIDRPNG
jgi:ACS family pantothenate transporter-like MFS transporter